MDIETQENSRNFDISSFAKAKDKMIATNDQAYNGRPKSSYFRTRYREYTPEEVANIIDHGTLVEQQKLSRNYFYKDGFYKQIIIHYATLLKYMGLLIPNPSAGKNLSTSHIQKRYYSAMDLVEAMKLPVWLTNCAQRALVDGCYYGVRVDTDKNTFAVLDLPSQYCCSRFKDASGNDLIEFDLNYFSTIDVNDRKAALQAYPKEIVKAYKAYLRGQNKGKSLSNWFIIPSDIGICFPFFDAHPLFLSIISATIAYDEALEARQEKDAEDIRKIIVQQIPHLTDGRLLFEPDEAEEIHAGTVGMLKGNKNISVLTTYADVESIASKTTDDSSDDFMKQTMQNIYAQAGVSPEIFAATNSGAIAFSLKNDLALMMYFANKCSGYVTNVLNEKCSNSNITFKYQILPVSYFNDSDFIEDSFKLCGSGYSILMPAIGMGLSQRDLVNVKELENDVLKLVDKLKPLSTAYTQSGSGDNPNESGETTEGGSSKTEVVKTQTSEEGGRPTKKAEDKKEETLRTEEQRK